MREAVSDMGTLDKNGQKASLSGSCTLRLYAPICDQVNFHRKRTRDDRGSVFCIPMFLRNRENLKLSN